jgi:DNA modification methylase
MSSPAIRRLRLADLDLAAWNPRFIDAPNFAGLKASLQEFGLLEMPVVNLRGKRKRVVSGHQRVRALVEDGYTHADCLCVTLDDTMEQAANVAMNNPAIRGRWDPAKAIPMLDTIVKQQPRGTDPLALDRLRAMLKVHASRDPKQMAVNKKGKPGQVASQVGTVYALGAHRLACGDACDPALIDRLRGDTPFAACITDPPFNVAYKRDSEQVDLEGDDQPVKDWQTFLHALCGTALHNTAGPCYVFSSSKHLPDLAEAWEAEGGVVRQWLAWCKTQPVVFVTRQTDFHPQFEWLLYGGMPGATFPLPETPRANVLSFAKPAVNVLHPTQKPLDLIAALVADVAGVEGVIFDPFAGSGTTLMACQQAGRVCASVEISPEYVDVIRKRWAEAVHGVGAAWESLTPPVPATV